MPIHYHYNTIEDGRKTKQKNLIFYSLSIAANWQRSGSFYIIVSFKVIQDAHTLTSPLLKSRNIYIVTPNIRYKQLESCGASFLAPRPVLPSYHLPRPGPDRKIV